MLYGPKGEMCCECARWDDCLVTFVPDFKAMKVIMFYPDFRFKEVKCDEYRKNE